MTENLNYTAPSDGYFAVTSGSHDTYFANAFINGVHIFTAKGDSVTNAVYVKKGMVLFFTSYGGSTGRFIPLK